MAGNIKVNSVQLGDSATNTNNFHLRTNVDGTMALARGTPSVPLGDILTLDANGKPTFTQGFLRFETEQALTGAAVDFLALPSWSRRITMNLFNASTVGTNVISIQAGTAAGVTASGYTANIAYTGVGAANLGTSSTTGLPLIMNAASNDVYGTITLTKMGTTNRWLFVAAVGYGGSGYTGVGVAGVTLPGVLDRLRIGSGANFDTGFVNVICEG